MASGGHHLSKEFFELVKAIGESRSKQEEDQIILREVATLKEIMSARSVKPGQMKEYLIRMLYVEMLGHDGSFGHIQAVKMVSNRDLLQKRVGYLACSLVLHSDHQFLLLLVNTIQTDLQSDNFVEVSMALTVIAKLVNSDLIPVLLPLVMKCLAHAQANVRKKAVVVLQRFHEVDNSCVSPHLDKIRKVLCDKDPSVMGASLHLFRDLCATNPQAFKDLVPSFVSILKQVTEHRLPREYDYHRMPAPWIQINLLRILALLGTADQAASEGMYEILHEVMKRADIGINVGYAIVYECVRTSTTIYPDTALIEEAARCISRFISSDNHNLKYLGINSLASIVQINAKYAAEHQLVVIDCLEDPDETLKRKTLDLLFSMTNPANVVVIVDKLTSFLRGTVDVYLRTELVSRITQLAERYAPDNEWYIHTMNEVFELGGDLVRAEVAHNIMRLIAEAEVVDDDDEDMQQYAVESYLELLEKPRLPDIMLQVIAWVLGEFGHRSTSVTPAQLIDKLCDVIDRPHEQPQTRSWFLDSIMKLTAHTGNESPRVRQVVERCQHSLMVDLQQRAHEFNELLKDKKTFQAVLPANKAAEEVEVDEDLNFLSGYVQEALNAGARPYSPPDSGGSGSTHDVYGKAHSSSAAKSSVASGLKTAAYAAPTGMIVADDPYIPDSKREEAITDNPSLGISSGGGGRTGRRSRKSGGPWGPKGYQGSKTAQAADPTPSPYSQPQSTPQPEQSTPSTTTQPAPRQQRAQLEHQPSEKELMAQQLFAGVAPSKAKRRGRKNRSSKANAAAAAAPTPASEPKAATSQDILGADLLTGIGDDNVDPLSSSQGSGASAGPVDLLGFDSAPASVNPLEDNTLFSSPPVSSPVSSGPPQTQQQQQPQQQAPNLMDDDPFGALSASSPSGGGGLLDNFLEPAAAAKPAPQSPLDPLPITTPQFGQLWKQYRSEVKVNVAPSSCVQPADYMKRMNSPTINLHSVQTIGQEMICAGKLRANGASVLVHGKLTPGKVAVIVKAQTNADANVVAPLLRKALA